MTSNICRANFNGGRTAQGNNRFQWDYGQILEISGIENLPDPFTAQFSNYPVLGTAKTTVGTGGRVEIPNEYFVSGQNIYCFIVLHADEDDGRTVYIATIPVTKRPKPIDDPITPTQQSTIDTAIAALQAGVSRAEGFAGDAEEQAGIAQSAATTATEAATRAEGAVADVEAAATRAETAAEGAGASATAAQTSARSAEQSAQTAQDAMNGAVSAAESASDSAQDADAAKQAAQAAEQDAQAAKSAAEASATAAAGSASAASGSASQAAQSASEADSSATAAGTSATNAEAARTGAKAAQTAAETAQASAEEAAANAEQSATTAEWYAERVERFLPTDTASGEIASFPDGADSVPMQSVVVTMEPIQDLHGYDHPWPAGGGKNKFDIEGWFKTVGAEYTKSGNSYTVKIVQSLFSRPFYFSQTNMAISISIGALTNDTATNVRLQLVDADGQIVNDSVVNDSTKKRENKTAAGVRFDWNASGTFTISEPQIEAGATATAFAPYSNECPISGRQSVTVTRSGVNVWDGTTINAYISDITGKIAYGNHRATDYIPVKSGATYYVYSTQTKSQWMAWYDSAKNYISGLVTYNKEITAPKDAAYAAFTLAYESTEVPNFSLNYPSTDHDYHTPSDIQSVTIQLGQTVYGGTLDVVSGDLVADRAMVTLDNESLLYQDGENISYRRDFSDRKLFSDSVTGLICSAFVTSVDKTPAIRWRGAMQYCASFIGTTLETLTDLINNGQLSICYPLATPITYHLTPQEVRTLLGANNVWSDAGETAVTYKADVQLYIDKRISALS